MLEQLIQSTQFVPQIAEAGDTPQIGQAAKLDGALLSVGFKLSPALFDYVSRLDEATFAILSESVLTAVQKLVGDHVQHNVYFKEFPKGVPDDTVQFWYTLILDALEGDAAPKIQEQLMRGVVNLLDLPKYGRYLHTYEEMVAAHEVFVSSVKDRMTILQLGQTLLEEQTKLFLSFAQSAVPLKAEDLTLLGLLGDSLNPLPETAVPVRENLAVINGIRARRGEAMDISTPTDLLRVACVLSDGDPTLLKPTRFVSFSRSLRRALLAALNEVNKNKASDVIKHRERWKRLAERLHPFDSRHEKYGNARHFFAVAQGTIKLDLPAAQIEYAFERGDVATAVQLLARNPGLLWRNVNRVLRAGGEASLLPALAQTIERVSGRVLLSMREYLLNESIEDDLPRIFINRLGGAWVTPDERPLLDRNVVDQISMLIDEEIGRRLAGTQLIVDKMMAHVALPISDKGTMSGFQTLSRGTVFELTENEVLRFFMYWREANRTTDYDLSCMFVPPTWQDISYISYTRLSDGAHFHSGDITAAPDGATEFIDVKLDKLEDGHYVIPQVLVFSGSGFHEVPESFFGFMMLDESQKGLPFEPSTVRTRFDLRGNARVALPMIFFKQNGRLWVKWMNLFGPGSPAANNAEGTYLSTLLLAKAIFTRRYLTIDYLASLSDPDGEPVYVWPEPNGRDDKQITIATLRDLIPE